MFLFLYKMKMSVFFCLLPFFFLFFFFSFVDYPDWLQPLILTKIHYYTFTEGIISSKSFCSSSQVSHSRLLTSHPNQPGAGRVPLPAWPLATILRLAIILLVSTPSIRTNCGIYEKCK